MKRVFVVSLLAGILSSCAGYRMGSIKPHALERVKTVSVSMLENQTPHPRAEAVATSALASALVTDGTYRIVSAGQADAVLQGKISSIKYSTVRGTRYDTLRPEELNNTVILSWELVDARQPGKVLASGKARGTSQLSVSANLQTARNNALPEACARAADAAVAQITTGY